MCGRYRRTTSEEELARLYDIPIPKQTDLPISYNIAPSQKVLTIRFNPGTRERSLDALQWGLVPYWSKDPKIGYKTINARVATVDTAPSYRQAFKKRRCLIPADGFYEWKKVVGGKIPYSIGMKDNGPFVFAGLWEGWRNPETEEWLRTCTIITGEPNELVSQIHTRMPVIGCWGAMEQKTGLSKFQATSSRTSAGFLNGRNSPRVTASGTEKA